MPILRIALVSLAVVAVVSSILLHQFLIGTAVGLISGLAAVFLGFTVVQSSSVTGKFGSRPGDVTTRIGICLAAAGLASAAIDPSRPFPATFRMFYLACLIVACVGALVLSTRKSSGN
jgi:hypothetical protein